MQKFKTTLPGKIFVCHKCWLWARGVWLVDGWWQKCLSPQSWPTQPPHQPCLYSQVESIQGAESVLSFSFPLQLLLDKSRSWCCCTILQEPPAKARRGTSNYCLNNLSNVSNYDPNNHNDSHIYRPLALLGRESDCTHCGAEPKFHQYHLKRPFLYDQNHQNLIFAQLTKPFYQHNPQWPLMLSS